MSIHRFLSLIVASVTSMAIAGQTIANVLESHEIYEIAQGSFVEVRKSGTPREDSLVGSGVVIGGNEVVTNCHVVGDADDAFVVHYVLAPDVHGSVWLPSSPQPAVVVERNEARDLCPIVSIN